MNNAIQPTQPSSSGGSTHDQEHLTAQQRLARTRAAMAEQLHGNASSEGVAATTYRDTSGQLYRDDPASPAFSTNDGVMPMLKRAGRMWWHFHPARQALVLAEPSVLRYARAKPWQAIGVAAGVGAALVLLRPWKLLSMGGLALAALRSTELTSVALALINSPKESYRPGDPA